MSSDQPSPVRTRRKLKRRNPPISVSSVQYPEKLKEGDDAHEDVTAHEGNPAQYMNQSVFSMIAAAGSKVDFNARFEEESSESEDDTKVHSSLKEMGHPVQSRPDHSDSQSTSHSPGMSPHTKARNPRLPTLPRLNLRTTQERDYMSQSTILPRTPTPLTGEADIKGLTPRDAPLLTQMLKAQARERSPGQGHGLDTSATDPVFVDASTSLVLRLKDIFGFETAEDVISEYPCWLLQSVLLQGYMYITENHICFYAYLPKKSNLIAKSGHLAKKGRSNATYKRFWFVLKGDVLSYFADQSDLYFPSGNVDLRYGISATLASLNEKGRDGRDFSIVTHQRTYHFKADSSASAKEWVKTLQKVIFRSHNDGDSVKISLPIENVLDIEESPVIDFADTFKIRVVDNDETYAIDEYFFSFFSFGQDALAILRTLIEGATAQHIPRQYLSASPITYNAHSHEISRSPSNSRSVQDTKCSPVEPSTPVLQDQVRATLMPNSPLGCETISPRPSIDRGRSRGPSSRNSLDSVRPTRDLVARDFSRASFDRELRKASPTSSRTRITRKDSVEVLKSLAGQSSDRSFVHSVNPGLGVPSPQEHLITQEHLPSPGSQILQQSDVFLKSAANPNQGSSHRTLPHRQDSNDSVGANSHTGKINIQPPTREPTRHTKDPHYDDRDLKRRPSQTRAHSLQQLVKAGGYPLQKAAGIAGFLRARSRKMSTILASESMGYVEKVSGMWTGGGRFYAPEAGLLSDDQLDEMERDKDGLSYEDRFRAHFALPTTEILLATFFGHLHRVLPLYGKIYVSNKSFCFRSLLPGTRTKMLLPLRDVENVNKEKGFRFGYSGLVLVIRGHEELFFEFSHQEARDDCAVMLHERLESMRYRVESKPPDEIDEEEAETAKAEHRMLQEARQSRGNSHDVKMPQSAEASNHTSETSPILFDDPRASILNFKPTESLRITCLTIGSRGDVQPYIALCKRLLDEGHRPRIATHAEFESWVRRHGIGFAAIEGDPAELMRICVENGMFTYSFLREASLKFRSWIDDLLSSAWKACQDTDLLIESPSAMAGIHIAEALGVPYFRAFTMPWTRTRAYPHAFAVPERKMGGAYNYMTYVMFDNVFWKAIAGQVNRWRKTELGLRSTSLDKMQPNKVPFLYNFSPSVVVPPIDYSDWIRVTGYWFLDESSDWTPPDDLSRFIARARNDGKRLVYVGFGSIVVSDPKALTKTVVDSVLKADVRAILSKGWSDRLGGQDANVPEVPLPPEILQIKSAPHDWLFAQIDAAAHHGGAGTTGASLRAGLPTIVKPFFGDQFFFGSRIEDLGVGVCLKKLNVSVFSRALWEATHSERMIVKARVLGEQIRKEDGVGMAVQVIYRDLEYAKSLIKHQKEIMKNGDNVEFGEESWTFVGDESDPELRRRIVEWDAPWSVGSKMHRRKSMEQLKGATDLGA